MKIRHTVTIVFRSLKVNKLRTGLTILGMFVGIASVIIVFSAGEGVKDLLLSQVEMFGTDIIETEIKVPTGKKGTQAETQSATAIAQGVQITTLTIEDMEDVSKLPNVKNAYAAIMGQEQVSYGSVNIKSMVFGVSANYIDIDKSEIDYGRFYTEAEDKSLSRVIVLGSKSKEKIFGDSEALGKYVRIHKSKYKVIGVLKKKGAVMQLDFDDFIYMPVRTLQKRIQGIDHVLYMVHQLHDVSQADQTAEEARLVIRENHNIKTVYKEAGAASAIGEGPTDTSKDDFRVVTMAESVEVLSTVTNAITILLLAIVAISLVVGGVGITNVLYVIVSERTAEIGLRKAVGATYKDIMRQFLYESIIITLLAGIIGTIFGGLVSYLISIAANSYGLNWKFIVPPEAFITAFGFSLIFGVLFGIFPARKAARLQPVEALRKE